MLKLTSPGRPRSHPCRDGTASCTRCGVVWVGRRFFCRVTAHLQPIDDFTPPSPSLAHWDSRHGILFLSISPVPIVALGTPHMNTHSAPSQSLETWIVKCEDYCRRLSAGLGPLIITLATTGIYNYNTLFWSSTSSPLLLTLLLHIPPRVRRLRQVGCRSWGPTSLDPEWQEGTSVRRRESRMTSHVPSLFTSTRGPDLRPRSDAEAERSEQLPRGAWGPLDHRAAWSRGLLRQDFYRPNSPKSDRALKVLQRNNPPHNSSFQCRYGLPSPVSKICAAARRRTDRKFCVGVQYGISRSRLCTLNNNTSSLPQLQIKRSKELGRRMPPMHAMQ